MAPKTKLLDQMREVLRLKHMSFRTEEPYVSWVRRFILFHDKRHSKDMGARDVCAAWHMYRCERLTIPPLSRILCGKQHRHLHDTAIIAHLRH
jgi:hypothetical protein